MNGFRAYPVGNGGAQSDLPGHPPAGPSWGSRRRGNNPLDKAGADTKLATDPEHAHAGSLGNENGWWCGLRGVGKKRR
jgi:hypothetical protein